MSREITDTSPKYDNQDLPDGRYEFMIIGDIVKKYGKNGGEFFVATLQHKDGIGQHLFMTSMLGPLLRAIGIPETEKNKFDWDTTEQAGKRFIGTVSHQPDKKDPSKIRQHMADIVKVDDNEIPFGE